MRNLLKISIIIGFVLLVSCNENTPNLPYEYQTKPTFTWGFAEFYGDYFNNYDLDENVITLNLFTGGLSVGAGNQLIGSGQYLIIEDVFVNSADTLLPTGTYTAVDSIIDVKPFTFLKGKEYKEKSSSDGIPSGAYIYYFEPDASKNMIKYIVSGTMTVSYIAQSETYSINCDVTTKDKKNIKGIFTGKLPHYDFLMSQHIPRKKMYRLPTNNYKTKAVQN